MAASSLNSHACYAGSRIILTTKHAKGLAIAPEFTRILSADVVQFEADTDELGTFSGEVERVGDALQCAKSKCMWGLNCQQGRAKYALASEGSFGPHPVIPFVPSDQEILYFIDRKHDFELHLSELSHETNYNRQTVESLEALHAFAQQAQFPSHALIVRPNKWDIKSVIFKGITDQQTLEDAFRLSTAESSDGKAWVETDMRAHVNPSRMAVIERLAEKFALRLNQLCPRCRTPGWGRVRVMTGLPCGGCGIPTEMVKQEVEGCVKCSWEQVVQRSDGLSEADPRYCHYCNP